MHSTHISELPQLWNERSCGQLTRSTHHIRLSLYDSARLAALQEMFPRRSRDGLLAELVSAALADFEQGLSYQQGDKIIATDEMGDPIYEDTGLLPEFLSCTKKHLAKLKDDQSH